MNLKTAKLCLDCEEIFDKTKDCPICASSGWVWLQVFIKPIRKEDNHESKSIC